MIQLAPTSAQLEDAFYTLCSALQGEFYFILFLKILPYSMLSRCSINGCG